MSDIRVRIYGEFNDKGFKKAAKSTSALEKQFNKLGKTIVGVFSVQQVIAFSKASVKAFSDDERAARKLTQTLSNMGLAFEDPRMQSFIAQMEATSGVLDDQLRPAMQSLLTTTGSLTKSQELLKLALDVAAGSGEDVVTVAHDLSKAYVGNTKGLSKYSLGLTKAELAGKSFAEIQTIIAKQFSGQNAAFLETYAGKVSLLNVAYANMQETVGKGLVDAFTILSGDSGIGGGIKAMDTFGNKIADVTRGIAYLISSFGSVSKFGRGLMDFVKSFSKETSVLNAIASLGREQKPLFFPTAGNPAAQEKARKKAEEDAIKRAKALAALQKKAALDQIKREREAAALKRAGTVFDMENIQIVAAMQGKIDGEQRLRLVALLAIHNEMAEVAEKTASAVLALNAPALANLGVIIKSGDNVTDVLNKLAIAQAKTALVALGITDLPKAKNPFEDWFDIIDRILAGLSKVKLALASIQSPSAPVVSTTTPAISVPSRLETVLSNPAVLASQVTNLSAMRQDTGVSSALGIKLKEQIDEYTSILSSTMGTGQVVDELTKRQAMNSQTNITVNVQGSVISEGDLAETLIDQIYRNQRNGQGILLSSVAI